MIPYGLEFLQVLINVVSVNATELHPFASISDSQKFALAWKSVLISFAHLPHMSKQYIFLLFMFGLFVNEIVTGSAWVYRCQWFKQNSNYCSKSLMITLAWFHHKVVLSPAVCCCMVRGDKKELGSTWVESISELPDYFAHWIAFISLRKALTVSYVRHYMNKWSIFGLRECKHYAAWSSGQSTGVQFREWNMLACCVTLNKLICHLVFLVISSVELWLCCWSPLKNTLG